MVHVLGSARSLLYAGAPSPLSADLRPTQDPGAQSRERLRGADRIRRPAQPLQALMRTQCLQTFLREEFADPSNPSLFPVKLERHPQDTGQKRAK